MRTRVSFVAALVACVCVTGAQAGGPGDVYNDFVADGKLSCNHSRADLLAVLRSGSLNQYGDPLTLARLKLAARKQLAGGCRHTSRTRGNGTGGVGASGRTGGGTPSLKPPSKAARKHRHRGSKPASPRQAAPARAKPSGGSDASFVAGRGLILGLLVAALAFGGWLTKHALGGRD